MNEEYREGEEVKVKRVKRAKDLDELQRVYDEVYGGVAKVEPVPYRKTGELVVAEEPETGELILPEVRGIRCPCGRKVKVWLAQKWPPIWAGRCSRCGSNHFRGESETIANLTEKQCRIFLKKAKQMRKRGKL